MVKNRGQTNNQEARQIFETEEDKIEDKNKIALAK